MHSPDSRPADADFATATVYKEKQAWLSAPSGSSKNNLLLAGWAGSATCVSVLTFKGQTAAMLPLQTASL
ncbi:hypothetical protein Q3A66_17310 [Hymenobacter sp. BT770]|uniref:hypothetical protein n=1 Tax=Hymenobacter sp. BT770 TaxID=2886942 RepID=UPI001D106320|nr:hypothetical protein [Hymenobacter sp. BT770]MCC3154933.1 hypothetical protein [Hymenobacter sp. BT770]MDO3416829.1 hypothetical protein [Hymenobacter sp. BT770]